MISFISLFVSVMLEPLFAAVFKFFIILLTKYYVAYLANVATPFCYIIFISTSSAKYLTNSYPNFI